MRGFRWQAFGLNLNAVRSLSTRGNLSHSLPLTCFGPALPADERAVPKQVMAGRCACHIANGPFEEALRPTSGSALDSRVASRVRPFAQQREMERVGLMRLKPPLAPHTTWTSTGNGVR